MLSVRFVAVNNFEMEKTSSTKVVHSAHARADTQALHSKCEKAEGQRRRLFCAECTEGPAGNRPEDHCSAQNAPRDSRRCARGWSKVEQTSSRLFCAECIEGHTENRTRRRQFCAECAEWSTEMHEGLVTRRTDQKDECSEQNVPRNPWRTDQKITVLYITGQNRTQRPKSMAVVGMEFWVESDRSAQNVNVEDDEILCV
jgi:hypothetical protein